MPSAHTLALIISKSSDLFIAHGRHQEQERLRLPRTSSSQLTFSAPASACCVLVMVHEGFIHAHAVYQDAAPFHIKGMCTSIKL
eukprot:scaffold241288_cov28-Tisochrysis_lutea.AAC.1